jgi:DNA-binding transcriptional LysR family regulator
MHDPNISRADLNLLVVFDAVARTRSVTTAADSLSLSQPAVSHALKRLRTIMRDPLFVRGRDGLVLTPRAEKCVADVEVILAAASRVLMTEGFDPATTTRSFRFGASDYAMMTTIPAVVQMLRTVAPHAHIDVAHIDADLFVRLEKHELDIAFVGASQPDGPFVSRELFRERFVGLVCQRHPLAIKAGQGTLTLKDYLTYPHIAVTFRNPRQSPIDAKLAELGKTRRVVMVTPNFAANIASLHGTDLIMSLPSRLTTLAHQQGLVLFNLPLAVPDYPYLMSWHRSTDDDQSLMWLRKLIIEASALIGGSISPTRRK